MRMRMPSVRDRISRIAEGLLRYDTASGEQILEVIEI